MIKVLGIITFCFGLAHGAHKDVGGGNGVGGTLLDRHLYAKTKTLDRVQLYKELVSEKSSVIQRFPFLNEISFQVIQSKTWILDSRKFSFDCVNPTAFQLSKQIWACQNSTEVRIHKSFWDSASAQKKTDLIFHEVLTALWLNSPNQKPINLAVGSILDLSLDPYEVQRRILASGLPVILTADQVQHYIDEMLKYAEMSCQFEKHPRVFSNWSALSSVKNENGLFLYAMPMVRQLQSSPCLTINKASAYTMLWNRFKELNSQYLIGL